MWHLFSDGTVKLYVEAESVEAAQSRIGSRYPAASCKQSEDELWLLTARDRYCRLSQGVWIDGPCKEAPYKKRYLSLEAYCAKPDILVFPHTEIL